MLKKTITLLVLAGLISACSTAASSSLQTTEPGRSIEARSGEQFTIVIEANPTTGYHWEMVGEADQGIVTLISRDYQAGGTQMPGSGGVDVWTFKAVGAGQTTITLGYYPPGNATSEPARTETFSVVVK